MMKATLEQTHLSDLVAGYVTKPGKPCGEALITMLTVESAILCAEHFSGRCWDPSGVAVDAWLLPLDAVNTPVAALPSDGRPQKVKPNCAAEKIVSSSLSADAATFVPSALSPNAPEFIPSILKPVSVSSVMSSDISTEDGEQSSEDEKALAADA